MSAIRTLRTVFTVVGSAFFVLYFYQLIYTVIGLVHNKWPQTKPLREHRFAAIISARNEEKVIANLLESLRAQNYPREKLDIFVIADNCTDGTADIALEHGARVYERRDTRRQGKGYALAYFFRCLKRDGLDVYDGYMIFDADNIVDPDFTREMNRLFDTGEYGAITGYRNSSNFAANWISSGYAIWFLREARFLNGPRMHLGTNCHVSGTGFLVSADVIRRNGGWPFFLLTEDIQFSVACAAQNIRIGYCESAIVYDEQPTTFKQSWCQRLRWSKGFYQVNGRYAGSLIAGTVSMPGRAAWSCFDMLATIAPGTILILAELLVLGGIALSVWNLPAWLAHFVLRRCGRFAVRFLVEYYLLMLLYGLLTVISEWSRIRCPGVKKILYCFTFPIFMLTYVPISITALFRKVSWTPIAHYGEEAARISR